MANDLVTLSFPDDADPRKLNFKYRSTSSSGQTTWEADDFVRQIVSTTVADIWTFAYAARILYQNPLPAGVRFQPGDVLTFRVITQSQYRGGQIFVWNPYDAKKPTATFAESARDDAAGVSTFSVTLAPWMTDGFHLKLKRSLPDGTVAWEPDASNRVWRPCDGASLWLKSGQCDVRSQPLALTTAPVEALVAASLEPAPTLVIQDVAEGSKFEWSATSTRPYSDPRFQVATYQPAIYPQAGYNQSAKSGEGSTITRPFPANPADPTITSRFVLGVSSWFTTFPSVTSSVALVVVPRTPSSFAAGLSVQLSLGNAVAYETVPATLAADQTWMATLRATANVPTNVTLLPARGAEPTPYDWIDNSRFFTPPVVNATYFTTEGVFGLSQRGKTSFAEPPSRMALIEAAFGKPIANCGVFAAREMPHGATILGGSVYFVVHAPHAATAVLLLVVEATAGPATRRQIPMALTPDAFYWWCEVPLAQAKPGSRYHFILNDATEVLDPAAREVQDRGSFDVASEADPNDPTTSWSVVLDVAAIGAAAQAQPWQTMGWQQLLVYEMHARRFTDKAPGDLVPLDLLVDELKPVSRLNRQGYLWALPVSALELLPVQEFSSAISWGYDPSFYFAIDGHYGGSMALARLVNAAHQTGRGVMLDVVYNHSLGSSLMKIAPDVYRNGDYDGDRMNCGHPMVGEFLRQATLYLWHTFGLDGFRFDDTQTIVTKCVGGWEFLAMIRGALRMAATATGRNWPYCVAENSATSPWDVSNPGFGVMDGQWGIDEAYRIRDASYDSWQPGADDSGSLKQEMDNPAYMGRPFYQATRFGESHDMVSAQDSGNQRIAARPPFGQGRQLAKALGTLTLLSNGVPMLFMGEEAGETRPFSFDGSAPALNPQDYDLPPAQATDNTRVLAWFRQLMGLRNDVSQGLQGNSDYQVVATGNRTIAFSCGQSQCLFVVVTFGTADQQQDSAWLGLPAGAAFKEIFNSSWPVFQVEFEPEHTNGGYDVRIRSGQLLNLPYMGAVVLQRA
ncbi:MAG TPA: alpha-amylase family glycosyl hydrolase [Pirellulales bacterium]|nr:alpha-amylase family glycosyl hydrolase [Pirellulales bacterium]